MDRLTVVDVGHGLCVVLESEGQVAIIDAPGGGSVLEYLRTQRLEEIAWMVASHPHEDHLAGTLNLASSEDVSVGRFYLNPQHRRRPDGKPTVAENRLYAAVCAGRKQGTRIVTSITTDDHSVLRLGNLVVSVHWPTPEASALGSGGVVTAGRLTLNSISAVLRVLSSTGVSVLLPGDLDDVGLAELLATNPDLRSDFLVAPHHGGLMGTSSSTRGAWESLAESVQPKEVLVSLARSQDSNPRDEMVDQLLRMGTVIRCTQLSSRCEPVSGHYTALGPLWSRGHDGGHCCAGSIRIDLAAGNVAQAAEHKQRTDLLLRRRCNFDRAHEPGN